MHSQRNDTEVDPLRWAPAIILVTYLAAGSLATATAFLVTGVEQFGDVFVGPRTAKQRVFQSFELVIAFIYARLLVAILVASVLTWFLKKALLNRVILALGLGLPVAAEFCFKALPVAQSWLGELLFYLWSWPDIPPHVLPLGLSLRLGASYMIPPVIAGLAASVVAIRLRNMA